MNLTEQVLIQARATPGAPALVFREHTTTYGELARSIECAARAFAAVGITQGDRFAIIMRNCPEFIVTYLGLARIGAVAVPLNPAITPPEVASALQHSGARGVALQQRFLDSLSEAPDLDLLIVADAGESVQPGSVTFEDFLSAGGSDALPEPIGGDALVSLLYTSGVTGKSKAVMLSHRNLLANTHSTTFALEGRRDDVFIAVLPMFHAFCWTVCVLFPLLLGAPVVIMESVQPFGELIDAVERHGITLFMAVPPVYSALMRLSETDQRRFARSVRYCLSGAAPLPPALQQGFEEKLGVPLVEGYGLTEASPVISVNPPSGPRKPGSVGPALPGVQIEIWDAEGHALPMGEIGEVASRSESIMLGYWRDPENTAAALIGDGWLVTGDMGFLDSDGYLHLVDRKKDLVIVKGLNVYPREVEELLMEHPAVAEAAVIGIPDDTGDEILKAFVLLREDARATGQGILAGLNGRLAPYKIPRSLDIVDDLPRNALGKILKRTLREQAR